MGEIIDLMGVDSLVYSSEYPHFDIDLPEGVGQRLLNHLDSDEDAAKLLHENAVEAFLKLEILRSTKSVRPMIWERANASFPCSTVPKSRCSTSRESIMSF